MSALPRRRLAALLALSPWLAAAGWLAPLPVRAATTARHWRQPMMGTWVDITVADGASLAAAPAVAAAFDEMARLVAMMSRFDPGSRVAALNRAAGRSAVPVPPEMLRVLQSAQDVNARTGGAFDVTVGALTRGPGGLAEHEVPSDPAVATALKHLKSQHLIVDSGRQSAYLSDSLTQIDLGGIAKLPILAAGLNVLNQFGIRGALINGGGDVLASARADGQDWRVGVRDPLAPGRLLAVLPLRGGVVASSGDYERFVIHEGRRYHHVIDPATGRPTRQVSGVTLVADQVDTVNGLGAAVMVAGLQQGPALLRRCGVSQALVVTRDGRSWVAPALAQRLQPPPGQARIRGLA